jgi:Lhr-like helicase
VAEDEHGAQQYLGTELRGHIFQKFLPGQFFTFAGKYYEMLRVTSEGQVLVRRAADHITGRPSYRQERIYSISAAEDSTVMGECRDMGTFRTTFLINEEGIVEKVFLPKEIKTKTHAEQILKAIED